MYIYIFIIYIYNYMYIYIYIINMCIYIIHYYMKMVLVFLILFQCHQESAQFNIVLVLLNIILKRNLKELLNSLKFFLFNVRGTKTIVKLQKGYENFFSYFEFCGRGTKTF